MNHGFGLSPRLWMILMLLIGNNLLGQFTKSDFDEYCTVLLQKVRASEGKVNGNNGAWQKAKEHLWKHIIEHSHLINRNYIMDCLSINYRAGDLSASVKKNWAKHYLGDENAWPYGTHAHHIIPKMYGGPNTWWNIMPLTQQYHTGEEDGIHNTIEIARIFPDRHCFIRGGKLYIYTHFHE